MRIPLSFIIGNTVLLGFISLCGGIVFLACTRRENPSWFLGMPLVAAFAVITMSPAVESFLIISDPSPPLWHPGVAWTLLSQAITFLLPLWAALFFWSQEQRGMWMMVLTAVAIFIALNALLVTFFATSPWLVSRGFLPAPHPVYVDGHQVKTDGEGMLFLFIHFMIGLPVLGIGFLTLAALTWYTDRKAGPARLQSTEALP